MYLSGASHFSLKYFQPCPCDMLRSGEKKNVSFTDLGMNFMPKSVKETFFFSPLRSMSHGHGWKYFNEKWLAPERYISLFDGAQREKAVGEACVSYLYFYERTIPLLKKHLSNPKIIIVLRD